MNKQRLRGFCLVLFGPSERERLFSPRPRTCAALLAGIIALGGFLRLYRLAELPPGFYCDEAGLGYNAYSILTTGRDENGVSLPLFVWSFDTSYKNPVFIYSAVIPVALFGLSEFAVRLTSAIYGTATVPAMFFLGRALMGPWVGLLAATFLALCPWHLHFSRIAFELITFPFFFVAAAACLVSHVRGKRRLPLAGVLLGLCLYTYAVAKLFVVLFLTAWAILFAPVFRRRWRESLAGVALFTLTALPVAVFDLSHPDRAGQYFKENTIVTWGAPAGEIAHRFLQNYGAFFSHRFLFQAGDPIRRHAVPGHGELYTLFAPLLVSGLLVAAGRDDRALWLLLLWLLFYPVAPALMTEIPSATRGVIGAPAFCLLAAVGAGGLLRLAPQFGRHRTRIWAAQLALVSLGAGVLALQATRYWALYTHEYPAYAARDYRGFQFGHREVVRYFLSQRDRYNRMMLSVRDNNQPQVFLLFYSAYPPARLHAGGLPGFTAESGMALVDLEQSFLSPKSGKILLAVTAEEVLFFDSYNVRHTVVAPDGTLAFVLIEPGPMKDFARSWWIAGPYDADDATSPPVFQPSRLRGGAPGGLSWRPYDRAQLSVDLNAMFSPAGELSCAWAVNTLYSDTARTARVFATFDVAGEAWINGEPVDLRAGAETGAGFAPDRASGTARLLEGHNPVVVKVCGTWEGWRFYFRLSEPDGRKLRHAWWEY